MEVLTFHTCFIGAFVSCKSWVCSTPTPVCLQQHFIRLVLVSCQTAGGAQVMDKCEHVDNYMGKESNIWSGIIPEHLSVHADAGIVREMQTRCLVVRFGTSCSNSADILLQCVKSPDLNLQLSDSQCKHVPRAHAPVQQILKSCLWNLTHLIRYKKKTIVWFSLCFPGNLVVFIWYITQANEMREINKMNKWDKKV